MSTAFGSYTVRPYEAADQTAVLRLLERALGAGPTGQRSAKFFAWKHARNPFGPSIATVAEHDGEVVGFRTFMRWAFRRGDDLVSAVRAVDTATDPAHQGQGVFRRLTLETLDLVRHEAAFVFNTPNAQSLPGYLKFGWREVGTVPLHFRVRRPVRFALHLRAAGAARGASEVVASSLPAAAGVLADAAAVEPLLAMRPTDDRLTTAHDHATLRWRYADVPGLDYRAIPVERGGRLAALGIGRLRTRGPLVEFGLAEVLAAPYEPKAAREVLRRAGHAGGDYAVTYLGAHVRGAGARAGYVRAPGQGLPLTVKPLQPGVDPGALDRWGLSLGDLEVF